MKKIDINRHLNEIARLSLAAETPPDPVFSDPEEEERLFEVIRETLDGPDKGIDWVQIITLALAGSGALGFIISNPKLRGWLVSLCKFLYTKGGLTLQQIKDFIREIMKPRQDPVDPNKIPSWLSEQCARAMRHLREILMEAIVSGSATTYLEALAVIEASVAAVQALIACAQANPMLRLMIIQSLINMLMELLGPYLSRIGLSPEQIGDFIKRLVESIIDGGQRPTLPIGPMPFSFNFNQNCLGDPRRYAPPNPNTNLPWNEIATEIGYSVSIALAVAAIIAAGPTIAAGGASVWSVLQGIGLAQEAVIAALVALGLISTASASEAEAFLMNESRNTRCSDTPYIDEADEDYIDTVVDPSGLSDVRDFL